MFYENVKKLCKDRKTNITQLARDVGMSTAAPASWKKGSMPKGETIQKIADYFGVSMDVLLRDESSPRNIAENITGSAVMQGNSGDQADDSFTAQEHEIIQIFRGLPLRGQTEFMSLLFQVEDKYKNN